jgi:hypothetical protein
MQGLHFLARACTLAPEAVKDFQPLINQVERQITTGPKTWYYYHLLGALHIRSGNDIAAIRRFGEAAQLHPNKEGGSLDHLFLAMVHHRQKRTEEAIAALEKARQLSARPALTVVGPQPPNQPPRPLPWFISLERRLLREEVEKLLKTAEP